MKKSFKRKNLSTMPQDEPDTGDLISKVQQQLSAIERKLDILMSQSSKRPFEKSYSQRPSGGFNQNRYDRGRQDNGPRERTYTRAICADCGKECEIPFKPSGGRPVYCKECFSKHRKDNPFDANRGNRPVGRDFRREGRFDKKPARKRPGSDMKKKPFYARIKKHS